MGELSSIAPLLRLQAWCSQDTESAWLNKLGSPEDTACKVCQDPWLRLGRPIFKHLPQQLSGGIPSL